ncbi:TonB-dependent receptor [Methylococcaceae bacterium WWC4]|nr:TonB-dependent receptor [Methylococcaceae bacterium WWC4]
MSNTHHRCDPGFRSSRLSHAIQGILLASALTASVVAQGEEITNRKSYHIGGGSLGQALSQFARDAGILFTGESKLTDGKTSKGLDGEYTVEEGFRKLLAGSGLTYIITDDNAVAIKVAESGSDAGSTLPAVTVLGKAVYDSADPYSPDYNRSVASTATKTDTPIMETPMSIQVVSRQVMQDQQAYRMQDALKNVSGVQQRFIGGGFDSFVVRGFELDTFQYRNGVRIPSLNFDMANVKQIEVLKGPASTIYGRTEPGGMINAVTKRPLADSHYSLEQRFGSYDYYRTQAYATGAVTDDKSVLYGLDLSYLNSDSFREHSFNDRVFVAPSLTWRPTDRTELNLTVEYLNEDRVYDSGLPATSAGILPLPITRQFDNPGLNDNHENILVDFNWSHQFNNDWKIQNGVVSMHRDFESNETYAGGFNAATDMLDRYAWFGQESTDMNTVYMNLTGKFNTFGIEHTLLLGGDFFNQEGLGYATDNFVDSVNIYHPVYPSNSSLAIYDNLPETYFRDQQGGWYNYREDTWYGLYFQDQMSFFGDKLHIMGGGRYDWTHVKQDSAYFTALDSSAETNDHFSPRVGVTFQPWSWLAVYGNFVESFGTNNGRSQTGEIFDPQTATQFESGIKTEWFDGRLTSTLAYYHLTKSNVLTPAGNGQPFQVPIGKARSQGLELDVSGQITDTLSLIGNYAYTDTRITNDNEGNEGKRLPFVPEHSGSLWLKYAFQQAPLQGFSLGAGLYAASERTGDRANSYWDGSYARLDLLGAYRHKIGKSHLTAQLNINNVADTKSFILRDQLRNLPMDPLMVFGSLRLEY